MCLNGEKSHLLKGSFLHLIGNFLMVTEKIHITHKFVADCKRIIAVREGKHGFLPFENT
jgi:hypothetical protein